MAGKGFRLRWQPTTSGGEISQSMTAWPQVVNGSVSLKYIFLKPNTHFNLFFNFRIVSPTGNTIFSRPSIDREIAEPLDLPMRGTYTLYIERVRTDQDIVMDDTFEGEFMFEDRKDK